MKRFFLILLSVIFLAQNGYGDSVCGTIDECRTLVSKALEKIRELEPPAKTLTTYTGAVFRRVDNHPELGEAWEDPDKVIWGETVKKDGKAALVNHPDAFEYCVKRGARLPSMKLFSKLAEFFGAAFDSGYMPQILPNLKDYWFWSSTREAGNETRMFHGFFGSTGSLKISEYEYGGLYAFRCVLEPIVTTR
jgi:hypothetical protein